MDSTYVVQKKGKALACFSFIEVKLIHEELRTVEAEWTISQEVKREMP